MCLERKTLLPLPEPVLGWHHIHRIGVEQQHAPRRAICKMGKRRFQGPWRWSTWRTVPCCMPSVCAWTQGRGSQTADLPQVMYSRPCPWVHLPPAPGCRGGCCTCSAMVWECMGVGKSWLRHGLEQELAEAQHIVFLETAAKWHAARRPGCICTAAPAPAPNQCTCSRKVGPRS